MRITVMVLALVVVVGSTGCAARRAETRRVRAAQQAQFDAEWAAGAEIRDRNLREWIALHPGERVPWALRRNKPLNGHGGREARYLIASEYMSDRMGARESVAFEDPPCSDCEMEEMRGRRFVKSCRFDYNEDRSQSDRLYVVFEDGKAVEWNLNSSVRLEDRERRP